MSLACVCGCGSHAWRCRFPATLILHISDALERACLPGVLTDLHPVVVCATCGTTLDVDEDLQGPHADTPGQRAVMIRVRAYGDAATNRVPTVTLRPGRSADRDTGNPAFPTGGRNDPSATEAEGAASDIEGRSAGDAILERTGHGVVTSLEPVTWPDFVVTIRVEAPGAGSTVPTGDRSRDVLQARVVGGTPMHATALAAQRDGGRVAWSATWSRLPWLAPTLEIDARNLDRRAIARLTRIDKAPHVAG